MINTVVFHHKFILNGKIWRTSEHYFQDQKFNNSKYEETIRLLDNPMEAAEMGRDRNLPLRKDWEEVKDSVMKRANLEKFKQNTEICEMIFSTENEKMSKIQETIIIGAVERRVQEKQIKNYNDRR